MDRRHLRGERTRTALVEAALDLFEVQGFDQTTVEEITAAAGVSPRSFFTHFAAKDQVLFGGYADRLDVATAQVRTAAPTEPLWHALEEAGAAVVEAISEQPQLFRRRVRLYSSEPALRAAMLRVNEEWIDAMAVVIEQRLGVADGDLRPRLAATILDGAMRCAIESWARRDDADLRQLAGDAFAVVRPALDGIGAAELRPVGARHVG